MASKNIVAKGTTYNGVESVTFPVSGGGDATFYEISDTTCTASDVLNSKYFYSSSGVKTQGTGTVPSPTLITKSITANGTYNASSDNADGYSSVNVSVSGGGGLEYEEGTWTPSEDVSQTTINFATTHATCPAYVLISDTSGADTTPTYTAYSWAYVNFTSTFGSGIPNGTTDYRYGFVVYVRRTTGSAAPSLATTMLSTDTSSAESSITSAARYWVNESWFKPYCNNASVMWRSGRTYKWIAVWKPTT